MTQKRVSGMHINGYTNATYKSLLPRQQCCHELSAAHTTEGNVVSFPSRLKKAEQICSCLHTKTQPAGHGANLTGLCYCVPAALHPHTQEAHISTAWSKQGISCMPVLFQVSVLSWINLERNIRFL